MPAGSAALQSGSSTAWNKEPRLPSGAPRGGFDKSLPKKIKPIQLLCCNDSYIVAMKVQFEKQ